VLDALFGCFDLGGDGFEKRVVENPLAQEVYDNGGESEEKDEDLCPLIEGVVCLGCLVSGTLEVGEGKGVEPFEHLDKEEQNVNEHFEEEETRMRAKGGERGRR
jgi:hypothetical protein